MNIGDELALNPEVILKHTPWVVARSQREGFLLYSSKSDELHLIPAVGYYIYSLCYGILTLGDVEMNIRQLADQNSEAIQHSLYKFVKQLIDRGLLEIAPQ